MTDSPRTAWRKAQRRALEDSFAEQVRRLQLPTPTREHAFHPTRKWRFDFAWPEHMVAVEIDGGTWSGGAHVRGRHYDSDAEKLNAAQALGWRVFRYTTKQVNKGTAALDIQAQLQRAQWGRQPE